MKFSTNISNFTEITTEERKGIVELDTKHFPVPWTIDQWKEFFELENSDYLLILAQAEQNLVGFLLFQLIRSESLGHLLKIVVDPSVRGNGYGRQLMGEGVAQLVCEGIDAIFLEVEHENIAARSLYQSFSFCELNTVKNFYGTGRNAVRMRRG